MVKATFKIITNPKAYTFEIPDKSLINIERHKKENILQQTKTNCLGPIKH
jgi:hypothetical protein